MENRKSGGWFRRRNGLLLALVLLFATALRLHGVSFGLPALNDPDEPLFMMTAFEMLQKRTLNPAWFGHPATTTLYSLALVLVSVAGVGVATGRYADFETFGHAVYIDPGLVWLPARLFIVACGVLCVALTYRLGKRLGKEADGARLGLLAALFLAANAIHIEYSQTIRTDVQATVFMLLGALSALAILREGRLRDYLLAGMWTGLACATKWPAAIMVLSAVSAGLYRLLRGHREFSRLVLLGVAAVVTLFTVSPFMLLDYQTVLANLGSEARPIHPGATGHGFLANLAWYVTHPLLGSLGIGGLLLAIAGIVWPGEGRRDWLVAILPGVLVQLLVFSAQSLLWERWTVSLMPFLALAAARALCGIADLLRARLRQPLRGFEAAAALLLVLPMLQANWVEVTERTNDTRQIASAWVRAHVPPGSTILLEHAGFDLLQGPWHFRFPLGVDGCVDAREALTGRIRYSEVEKKRTGRPIIDLGNIDYDKLPTCRADYAIITHFDRYQEDAEHYAEELARYRAVLAGGRLRETVRPVPGVSGGPVVRIVELSKGVKVQ